MDRGKIVRVVLVVATRVVLIAVVSAVVAVVAKLTENKTLPAMYAHEHIVAHVNFVVFVAVVLASFLRQNSVLLFSEQT